MRVIGQRITFGGDGNGGRQAGEIAVLQGGDGGVTAHLDPAMPNACVEFHIGQRQHRREGMGLIAALAAITAQSGIDQHLPQNPCIVAQGMADGGG